MHIYVYIRIHVVPFVIADLWGVLCQTQVLRTLASNYIPQKLWDVVTCHCPMIAAPDTTHFIFYDDVIKWNHFPRYCPFVRGIHRSPVNSPHKGQWRGALIYFFVCAWTNEWVNNRDAGDLRRNHAPFRVIVMSVYEIYGSNSAGDESFKVAVWFYPK